MLQKHHKNSYIRIINRKSKNNNILIKYKQNIKTINEIAKKQQQCRKEKIILQQKQRQLKQSKMHTIQIINIIVVTQLGNIIYHGKDKINGKIVAIKQIQLNHQYKQRQISICKKIKSPFIVTIHGLYQNRGCINIVMDYYAMNLSEYMKIYKLSVLQIKLFSYQLIRALMYLHSKNICHRNINPSNILISKNRLVLCDFSHAKIMNKNQNYNLGLVCSQSSPYTAPEILLGCNYDLSIDVWAVGCVIAEMIGNKSILFKSNGNNITQMIQIMKMVGPKNIFEFNKININKLSLPFISGKGLPSNLQKQCPLIENLLNKMLIMDAKNRIKPIQILCDNYFDQLRSQNLFYQLLQQNNNISYFFKFNQNQYKNYEHLIKKLIPNWIRQYDRIQLYRKKWVQYCNRTQQF